MQKMNVFKKIWREIKRPFRRVAICSCEQTREMMTRLLEASILHRETFLPYKNKFAGRKLVIIAPGPSLNDYIPIEDAIYIGLNRAVAYDKIKFDFLFCADRLGIRDFLDEFAEYDCVKFVYTSYEVPGHLISQSDFLRFKNARRYIHDSRGDTKIPVDIGVFALKNGDTVALHAMQFALYTNPSVIYLVGCDCTARSDGYFCTGKSDIDLKKRMKSISLHAELCQSGQVNAWKEIREFADLWYPETRIISVNPVGLRGVFEDIYQ